MSWLYLKINKNFSNGTLKIIYVGNSFSQNSTEYIYDILTDLGYENPMICIAYKGGCSLAQHLDGLKNNTQQYTLQQATLGGEKTDLTPLFTWTPGTVNAMAGSTSTSDTNWLYRDSREIDIKIITN